MEIFAEKVKLGLNPNGNWWSNDNNKFGQKLLEKWGWKKGEGLGLNNQGISSRVKVPFKCDLKGIGYKESDMSLAQQGKFQMLLTQLNVEEVKEERQILSLEDKSKQSRSRVHYKKYTRGKDISRYSNKDLNSIIGNVNFARTDLDINSTDADSITDVKHSSRESRDNRKSRKRKHKTENDNSINTEEFRINNDNTIDVESFPITDFNCVAEATDEVKISKRKKKNYLVNNEIIKETNSECDKITHLYENAESFNDNSVVNPELVCLKISKHKTKKHKKVKDDYALQIEENCYGKQNVNEFCENTANLCFNNKNSNGEVEVTDGSLKKSKSKIKGHKIVNYESAEDSKSNLNCETEEKRSKHKKSKNHKTIKDDPLKIVENYKRNENLKQTEDFSADDIEVICEHEEKRLKRKTKNHKIIEDGHSNIMECDEDLKETTEEFSAKDVKEMNEPEETCLKRKTKKQKVIVDDHPTIVENSECDKNVKVTEELNESNNSNSEREKKLKSRRKYRGEVHPFFAAFNGSNLESVVGYDHPTIVENSECDKKLKSRGRYRGEVHPFFAAFNGSNLESVVGYGV